MKSEDLYLEPYQNVFKDDILNCHANGMAVWVKADPLGIDLECSYCGHYLDEDTPKLPFCPSCGREMKKLEGF